MDTSVEASYEKILRIVSTSKYSVFNIPSIMDKILWYPSKMTLDMGREILDLLLSKSVYQDVAQVISLNHNVLKGDPAMLEHLLLHPVTDLKINYPNILHIISSRRDRVVLNSSMMSCIIRACQKCGLPVFSIRTSNDIDTLISYVRLQEKRHPVIIDTCYDYKMLFRNGIFPSNEGNIPLGSLADYVSGMDETTFEFWHGKSISVISNILVWKLYTLDDAKREGIEKCNSMPLIMLSKYPDQYIYPISKRPKNNMDMYNTITNLSVLDTEIHVDDSLPGPISHYMVVDSVRWTLIPVTRYSAGMRRSLFYSDSDQNTDVYCGTFYYLERDSKTYLRVNPNRIHISFNKSTAYEEITGISKSQILSISDAEMYLEDHINGTLPSDLIMTPSDYCDYNIEKLPPNVSQTPHYTGVKLELYGAEDSFDQVICEAAREKDIDVVLLMRMIGSHGVVSEVLDTRNRDESFSSLLFTYEL